MKLLTWNTHSLVGKEKEQIREEQRQVAAYLGEHCPDVVALQEVNQPREGAIVPRDSIERLSSCECHMPLREGNYLLDLMGELPAGYRGVWLPMKKSYDRWEEGLAFLYRGKAAELRWLPLSLSRDYNNWKTRMALFLRREGEADWFCNLHLGWWEDEEEPFLNQWHRLARALPRGERLWLMGDFNSSPDIRGEGYDTVASGGFYDCYTLARQRQGEETVTRTDLDGWRERASRGSMRIDQVWCRHPARIRVCRICMDGKEGPLVSDHYGVWVETDEK
ncbi:MAG: endonuclease/exonuclease/phosphatase family protein [Clostridia bacterium]|nr:endonuclease/exonuclease/phosphatase family protein [Clostridia bacterium]